MNILVTGAKGFVGKNLVENLKNIRDGKDKTRSFSVEKIYEYDIDSEALMKETDNCAAYACMNDYVCVIAEGFASWFWLQVIYSVPVICINPVLEPETEYEDFMTDELEYILKSIKKDRGFQTSECMCVISSENYEDVEEYDNIFLDNTVIRSDDMFDSEEFWTENGSIIKAIKYIKLNYA